MAISDLALEVTKVDAHNLGSVGLRDQVSKFELPPSSGTVPSNCSTSDCSASSGRRIPLATTRALIGRTVRYSAYCLSLQPTGACLRLEGEHQFLSLPGASVIVVCQFGDSATSGWSTRGVSTAPLRTVRYCAQRTFYRLRQCQTASDEDVELHKFNLVSSSFLRRW